MWSTDPRGALLSSIGDGMNDVDLPAIDLVDAHVHVWDRARHPQPWIDPVTMAPIDRDFDLLALRADVGADVETGAGASRLPRVVLVQTVPVEAETRDLLQTALDDPLVAGVVGWVDLTGPDVAARLMALLAVAGGKRLVGVRHLLQDELDPAWLDRPDARRGAQAVADAGLALDLVIRSEQLPAVVRLARALPGLRLVLDHLGKPPIAAGELEPWRTDLLALAAAPNATAKLSGLVTEAVWASWSVEQLARYTGVALDAFGPSRLMFGSDWPVARLATTYPRWLATAGALTSGLDTDERAAVFGATAARVYRFAD
jgi:predicted TIM-barrel fold metal-dependent hydrolase